MGGGDIIKNNKSSKGYFILSYKPWNVYQARIIHKFLKFFKRRPAFILVSLAIVIEIIRKKRSRFSKYDRQSRQNCVRRYARKHKQRNNGGKSNKPVVGKIRKLS